MMDKPEYAKSAVKENRILSEKWNSSGRTSDTYF